jgi:hypothetical protein
MKLMTPLILAALTLSNAHGSGGDPASDRDKTGNGGGVMYCPDYPGARYRISPGIAYELSKFQTLDLWEGEVLPPKIGTLWPQGPGMERQLADTPKAQWIQQAMSRLRSIEPPMALRVQSYLDMLSDPRYFSPLKGVELIPTHDVKTLILKKGCTYLPVYNWLDPGQTMPGSSDVILRDNSVYQRLLSLDQAALDLHEAVFKTVRSYRPEALEERFGSRGVRRLVALLMSDEVLTKDMFDRYAPIEASFRSQDLALRASDPQSGFWIQKTSVSKQKCNIVID